MEGTARPLLERWRSAGHLGHWNQLIENGTTGRLRSGVVPYEPPGLMSAFTGYTPGGHGWFTYWEPRSPEYRPRVLGSGDRWQPCLWNRPEFADLRFAVVNVCGTHPPTQLPGHLISYPMQKTLRATYPRELHSTLARQGIRLIHDVSVWYSGQTREIFLQGVLAADQGRLEAALELWSTERPDILILNLTGIDRVSHFFWHELEPETPIREEEGAIFQAFRSCERALGRLMERVGDDTSLLAFSEIGFGPLRAYCSINDVLEGAGLLTREKGDEVAIRWHETRAFEAAQGSHGININVRGEFRDGTVDPDDRDRIRNDVAELLRTAINPHTGCPLFCDVLPREAIYQGPHLEKAPDLILVPADERYQPLGEPFWANHVNRRWQSGWHRRDSFWAAIGPAFPHNRRVDRIASPEDIAPTLSRMVGRDPLPDWSGRDLGDDS
ncbi:MAG: hypothetical protein GY856_13230 [bacterium]|nr:hypothetical protein [bacterium]